MKYITDTNVLLKKPSIIKEHECVIPSSVLREIEHLERTRKSDRQLQFEIRGLKRYLDENETHTYVDLKDYKFTLDEELDPNYVDNILIQIAVDNGYGMITNDRLVREKCKLYNIPMVDIDENVFIEHKGFKEVLLSETEFLNIMDNPYVNVFDLLTNEYIIVNNVVDGELLDILKWTGDELVTLRDEKGKFGKPLKTIQFGDLVPKDEQQIMAIDSILNNQLTSLRGRAGSGKSLIALHTAWHLVESEGYKLVIFTNPVKTLNSAELGFYKGDRFTKLMQTVGTMLKSKFGDEMEIERLILDGSLDILPFSDIRGYDTTGRKTIIWIVESQNLTSELLKLGLQRVDEYSKVIVDGDYDAQVDKDVYAVDNGMKRMSEVFRGSELYGEIELQNVYRSRLADIADMM